MARRYCSDENYLSLKDFEMIAEFILCTGSKIFLPRLDFEFYNGVKYYRVYLSFYWHKERAVYLGCSRKLKNVPSSYWLNRLFNESEDEKTIK